MPAVLVLGKAALRENNLPPLEVVQLVALPADTVQLALPHPQGTPRPRVTGGDPFQVEAQYAGSRAALPIVATMRGVQLGREAQLELGQIQ